jgi:tetratricopeptide (TPR) repeat protein
MNTRQFFWTLRLAALLAVLPSVNAIADDAAAQKEVAALGRALAKALNERSADAFMRRMDFDAIRRLVVKDLGLAAKDADALRQQLPASVRRNAEISMRALEQNKGFAKFLRSGVQEGKAYALLRLDMAEGVDYVKYFVSPSRAVEDWYVYTSAALFSTTARFNLATMLKNDSLLYSLFGTRSVSAGDVKPFLELRRHLIAGDFATAYRALEDFPEGYRRSRQWAVMRVTYGGHAGDENYRAALRHLGKNFGGDADLQLILIDHYFFEKQYEKALAGIATLEQAVGGEDASTSSLRGNLLTTLKRHDDAAKACRRGMALEPDFKQAYWCLVTVGLDRNDGKLAVEGLVAYEKAFDVSFDVDELAGQDAYKKIARTREFGAWAKSRKR